MSVRSLWYYPAFVVVYWSALFLSVRLLLAFAEPSFFLFIAQFGVHLCLFGAAGYALPRMVGRRIAAHAWGLGAAWLVSIYVLKAIARLVYLLPDAGLPEPHSMSGTLMPFSKVFELLVFAGLAAMGSGMSAGVACIAARLRGRSR